VATQLLRMREVQERTKYSASGLYKLIRRNLFPRPVRVPGTRSSYWREEDVQRWLDSAIRVDKDADL